MQQNIFDTSTDFGEVLKQRGITLALRNANEEHYGWSDKAYNHLKIFIQSNPRFLGEDVRNYATLHGLEEPPHQRAWGAIMLRAARAGIIKKIGNESVKNAKAHKAIATLWEVVK